MEFIPLIQTCTCAMCGEEGSCTKHPDSKMPVCRACDPVSWEQAAADEKNMYMSGINLEKLDAAK